MPLTRRGYDIVSRGLAEDVEKGDYTVPFAIGRVLVVGAGLLNPITLIPTAVALGFWVKRGWDNKNEK